MKTKKEKIKDIMKTLKSAKELEKEEVKEIYTYCRVETSELEDPTLDDMSECISFEVHRVKKEKEAREKEKYRGW